MVKLPDVKSATCCAFVMAVTVACFTYVVSASADDTTFEIPDSHYREIWGGNPPAADQPPVIRAPRPQKAAPVCGVYLFQCGEFVKIGVSRDVIRRMAQTRTFVPVEVKLVALIECPPDVLRAKEAALHEQFKSLRIRGEWFRVEGALADFIAEVSPAGFAPENAKSPSWGIG